LYAEIAIVLPSQATRVQRRPSRLSTRPAGRKQILGVGRGGCLTLEDTVEFFNLVLELKLTGDEKKDLVALLRCL